MTRKTLILFILILPLATGAMTAAAVQTGFDAWLPMLATLACATALAWQIADLLNWRRIRRDRFR
ncbi:hypothetical protein RM543_16370 [Roseicyclus sp. F158]|uniref:Uncharacterized protein n=1 Tax=Tropicimonas omnivorans TaxID=3075590 RepID=A0ABU3DKR5_9RHOB|nr:MULTISPECIES: hypothetical protein [Roseobacteraceae]MDT0684261.1 hypothetical protein [Roseicyclus sp. F158]